MPAPALCRRLCLAFCMLCAAPFLAAQTLVQGTVVDEAGDPVAGALVIFEPQGSLAGPSAWTVFSQADGSFRFPEALPLEYGTQQAFRLRALGYAPEPASAQLLASPGSAATLQLIARRDANLAAV